jgi:hypothetical protein
VTRRDPNKPLSNKGGDSAAALGMLRAWRRIKKCRACGKVKLYTVEARRSGLSAKCRRLAEKDNPSSSAGVIYEPRLTAAG